ncbi:MAG: PhoH family protein [Candidatus Omnitrophica bacterium]|nr:PhoH family protein [Candidatus Omnitrophota bacterium]
MERTIKLKTLAEARSLVGPFDRNLRAIEKEYNVKLVLRGEFVKISGKLNNILRAEEYIHSLLEQITTPQLTVSKPTEKEKKKDKSQKREIAFLLPQPAVGKPIGPKTKGQREYVEAIKKYDIVFGIGPAGTGKTYLAMASAVEALKSGFVRRIILTRPAIEAGESLGYLPGDMYEKISPYLRPLYDALYDMMEAERIEKYLDTGIIEVAPLAYMRGRTLNDAFIILDEAQNATQEQMKMFLTRLGYDSKAVITGDITQSDLPGGKPIGLLQAMDVLKSIEGIRFVFFTGADVVRHELVQKIIEAYEKISSPR